ncbi:MAG: hypothetical protein A2W61_04390 [Deltaproteobacteria bacterium RIFCSPLOWO2_01_44_7]|nr:MAG: hypothetical protein A2712_01870 [Deltaproteobacteria bacterium RIFCSPHIGHO2_01_FULL_43_49]OGQ15126.1 MAG: hypothetical protein A3D22_03605 [Deltaproteobacteria bacterium RIFCSPHIGHO2_02_FULL_44_53]OGQ27253.1 MAG: hypothetical protein A3D98_02465 [Deltaproteobacteria bacterium RIFCSPHIGHO2_12_FULL_44_21]OGQ31643.1 MAG: hypothetical protein A2979_04765 [Deltaproteobacteria bacterium RIFCSPLOWO2_01_FULL_45_74]OGQ42843.1 MAG: hypothetical protein A3I70_07070 [Deltaproteobacteria bacterium 
MRPNLNLLKNVLSLPTAPFHEQAVIHFIKSFCAKLGVVCKQDRFGNLKAIYKRGKQKPIAFTAHMDHPGFEVLQTNRLGAKVRLLGGVPDKYFLKARVVLVDQDGLTKGRVLKILNKKKREFWVQTKRPVRKKTFGYLDLPAFQLRKGMIHTKAADNLMSVAILLNLLEKLVRKKARANVVCLFTRAEEVGFIGASKAIQNRFLPRNIPIVVLETSSAKAGKVEIGSGPVLRVGDRFSSFSWEMDLCLRLVAQELKSKEKSFEYQRGLLAGGRCEASLYVVKKYLVGGLALPLGNYHNVGAKSYATEYVSLKDYQNLLKWLIFLSANFPKTLKRLIKK